MISTNTRSCPRCERPFVAQNSVGETYLCECGWYDDSGDKQALKKVERKTMWYILLASLTMLIIGAGITYFASPNGQILLLTTKANIGMASHRNYLTLADFCLKTKDYQCAQKSFTAALRVDPTQDKVLIKLARCFSASGNWQQAADAYAKYVSNHRDDLNMVIEYGKMLEESGNVDLAISHYKENLMVNDKLINLDLAESLVKLLITQNRQQEAQEIMDFFKEKTQRSDLENKFSGLQSSDTESRSEKTI